MPTPAPEDNTVGALPAQTFHPFPRLPLELRQEIWKLALPLAPVKPGVCILSESMTLWGDVSGLTVKEYTSPLKVVCQEARQTAIENLPVGRDYDPLVDILYIGKGCFFPFTSWASIDDFSRVKYIALSLPVTEAGLNMAFALFGLPSLEELSIVYPKSTGTVDIFDDVIVPETGPRKLRRFTEDEMSSFVIKADLIYHSHGGDVPIIWEKDANAHLDFLREELSRETLTGRLPCWDEERQRLMLTMHPLCFDVGDESR